jgi:hypothetical protein
MSASHVPVPTGDLHQLAATESAGGSAPDATFDLEVELRHQMERDELLQGSLPEAFGHEAAPGGGNGDDDEFDLFGMNGWPGGFDNAAESAQAEFNRATIFSSGMEVSGATPKVKHVMNRITWCQVVSADLYSRELCGLV